MIITCGRYRLRPYKSGLCWQVDAKDSESCEYKAMEFYPRTMEDGLMLIYEFALKDGKDASELDEAVEQAKRLVREICEQAEKLAVVD